MIFCYLTFDNYLGSCYIINNGFSVQLLTFEYGYDIGNSAWAGWGKIEI